SYLTYHFPDVERLLSFDQFSRKEEIDHFIARSWHCEALGYPPDSSGFITSFLEKLARSAAFRTLCRDHSMVLLFPAHSARWQLPQLLTCSEPVLAHQKYLIR